MVSMNLFAEAPNRKIVNRLGNFSVLEYTRDVSVNPATAQTAYFMGKMGVHKRQVIASLNNEGVILQAGAMQITSGNVTINTYVSTVTEFYSFLMRIEDDKNKLSEKLKIQLSSSKRGYKDFLYHVNRGKNFDGRYLKLKEEKIEKRVLEPLEVQQLVDACRNGRDAFLLTLLYETGFRIGECLALWLEDIDIVARTITIIDRGYLSNNAEIKTVTSERTINVSENLINRFLDYVADYHDETIETNFVFFKITGMHQGEPLDYQCIDALFKKLRKRTGIYATPHSFRHTHFDKLRTEGWGFEKIQKRGGWSNVQTPMSTYSHPSEDEIRNE